MKAADVYYYDCNDGCRYYQLITEISDDNEEYSYIPVKVGQEVYIESYDAFMKDLEEDGLKLASEEEKKRIQNLVQKKINWLKKEKERVTKMITEGLRTERQATAKSLIKEILKGVK